MLVQSSLILDHAFFAADSQSFEELKNLFTLLECTSHQKVVADDDGWEGLYIWTRGGYYLEVLHERRPQCTGLCQKPINSLRYDAREILDELPDLPWKSFDRSIEGQKWFTALACDDYLDLTTPFNTWVMHYYQMNLKHQTRFRRYDIHSFQNFIVEADSSLKERIKMNSSWFNAEKSYGEDAFQFKLQTLYSDGLDMEVQFRPQVQGTQLKSIEINFVPGFDFKKLLEISLYHFALTQVSETTVRLTRA